MEGTMIASCPGSCGELFQCVVDGREFLMSYGIEKKSQVLIGPQTGVVGEELRPKMLRVINELTDQIDFDFSFQTDISIGKGYAVNFRCLFFLQTKGSVSPSVNELMF